MIRYFPDDSRTGPVRISRNLTIAGSGFHAREIMTSCAAVMACAVIKWSIHGGVDIWRRILTGDEQTHFAKKISNEKSKFSLT